MAWNNIFVIEWYGITVLDSDVLSIVYVTVTVHHFFCIFHNEFLHYGQLQSKSPCRTNILLHDAYFFLMIL